MKTEKTGWKVITMAICICAAFGWWGVLYPELTMMPDTYRVVREEGTSPEESVSQKEQAYAENVGGSMAEEWDFDRDIYFEILQAPKGKVRFKSRLLMGLGEIF